MNPKRQAIWDKTGGRCWYCGEELPEKGWHADHVEPIRRNFDLSGKSDGTCLIPEADREDNKVPACRSCNINKHSLSVEQFREAIAAYVKSLNNYSTQYVVAKRYGLVTELQQPVIFWFERQGVINGKIHDN